MERAAARPDDAKAVAELIAAQEESFYGPSTFTQADLEAEWAELDDPGDVSVIRDGERIVGYAAIRRRHEMWRVEGYVHPDARQRGVGTLIATGFEDEAKRAGAHRIQNSALEADGAGCALLESRGYEAMRVFREMRIELGEQPPAAPRWPEGLRPTPFDPERDATAFHAAHQEAFADHWGFTPYDFAAWAKGSIESERFEPSLWCVVRAGDEIAAGTFSTGDTYGGGFVHSLFTRRPWRRQGVGAALLADAFSRLHEHGERSVGLGVDAASDTGAFRLYERAGMRPALGWVAYEKSLDP